MLGCIHPMSSPMMKTIFGFAVPWAEAVTLAIAVEVHNTTRAIQSFLNMLMVFPSMSAAEVRAAAFAQLHPPTVCPGRPARLHSGGVSIPAELRAVGRMPFARSNMGRGITDALCVFGRWPAIARGGTWRALQTKNP